MRSSKAFLLCHRVSPPKPKRGETKLPPLPSMFVPSLMQRKRRGTAASAARVAPAVAGTKRKQYFGMLLQDVTGLKRCPLVGESRFAPWIRSTLHFCFGEKRQEKKTENVDNQ